MTRASRPVLGPWPQRMVNPVRNYDWGSSTFLARLQDRPPTGAPEAELWMGAHPDAPSSVLSPDGGAERLDALLDHAGSDLLGAQVMDAFGPRLPFLLKILAIDLPLSIQVHPGPAAASAGYAAQGGEGEHLYTDPYPKPELLYALAPVDALCGFRTPSSAAHLLGLLRSDRLALVGAPLHTPGADTVRLQRAFRLLATWPEDDRAELAADVTRQTRRLLVSAGAPAGNELTPSDRQALTWAARLSAQHPKDPLVAAPLLLELLRLEVGQTLLVPAGVPHAYLHGAAIELAGSSDNVMRAGLTHQPVAVEEMLALLDGHRQPVRDVPCRAAGPHELLWQPDVAEFQLTRVRLPSAAPVQAYPRLVGPQVVLCTAGPVTLACGRTQLTLSAGQSAFLGASSPPMSLTGPGEVFRAAVGIGGLTG